VPTALYDEFIYLGFGRFFSGTAALPSFSRGAFGSFGYGLFIAPAFILTSSFGRAYHLVLLINAALISSAYFLLYYIARVALRVSPRLALAISFVTCLYPSFLLFSNYAISDNAFVPLFLLVMVCAARFIERGALINAAALGLSTGLLYAVHNRSLGVIAVISLLLIYLVATHRYSLPATGLVIVIAALVMYGTRLVDAVLLIEGWGRPTAETTIAGTLGSLLTLRDLRGAFVALVGEVYYLLVGTVGLWTAGFLYGAAALRSGSRTASLRLPGPDRVFVAFSLLSVLSVLFVSSVYMPSLDPALSRPDFLLTGRYNEGVAAIPVLFGITLVISGGFTWRWLLIVLPAFALSGLLSFGQLRETDWLLGPAPRINIFAMMGWLRGFHTVNIILVGAITASLFVAMIYLSRFRLAFLAFVGLLFIIPACIELRSDVWPNQLAIWPPADRRNAEGPLKLGAALARIDGANIAVSYDMAVWNAFLYSNDQLWFPRLRFLQYDSGGRNPPKSDIVIAGRGWTRAGQPGAFRLAGCETLADNCLYIGSTDLSSHLIQVPLGTEIGSAAVIGVDAEGLYPEEGDSTTHYRWTNGNASLIVPTPDGAPARRLSISLRAPARLHLTLAANQVSLFDGEVSPGEWEEVVDLPRVGPGSQLVISLRSDTFVPTPVDGYTRTLGVQLVSLRIL